LATQDDLNGLGVTHQPPGNLNFYTRQNGQGSGVIVITSSRPIIDPELNIVVKVSEGNATRLQHIKTVLMDILHRRFWSPEQPAVTPGATTPHRAASVLRRGSLLSPHRHST
jgi:Tfp pilus assembly protein FimV